MVGYVADNPLPSSYYCLNLSGLRVLILPTKILQRCLQRYVQGCWHRTTKQHVHACLLPPVTHRRRRSCSSMSVCVCLRALRCVRSHRRRNSSSSTSGVLRASTCDWILTSRFVFLCRFHGSILYQTLPSSSEIRDVHIDLVCSTYVCSVGSVG